jgi:hypothetical protein
VSREEEFNKFKTKELKKMAKQREVCLFFAGLLLLLLSASALQDLEKMSRRLSGLPERKDRDVISQV